jgi:hypothetical protein
MRRLALLALVSGGAGVLSDREAQNIHVENDTAQSRRSRSRG